MKYKSPISIRVGKRSELDRKFAKWMESLPENAVLSEEIKRCCVENIELKKEVSDIENIKAKIAHQEKLLRDLEAKIRIGVIVEGKGEGKQESQGVDEETMRRVQILAQSMTDW